MRNPVARQTRQIRSLTGVNKVKTFSRSRVSTNCAFDKALFHPLFAPNPQNLKCVFGKNMYVKSRFADALIYRPVRELANESRITETVFFKVYYLAKISLV